MIKPQHAIVAVAVALVVAAALAHAAAPQPRSSPEAQGISSAAVRAYIEAADKGVRTMHSFILVRHGYVVAEAYWKPEAAEKPHVMHSLSKSFTSTAVGMAVAEGKLSVEDPVLKFFPDDAPPSPSENLKAMKVKDLLTMTCGHEVEPNSKELVGSWVKGLLAHDVPHKPGTTFRYNSLGTYVCSAIVQKVTGQTVLDYLKPRLFEPLGIDDPKWDSSPEGVNCGGWGLFVRTEDVAYLGQLYLEKGKWYGKQIIPADWAATATSKLVPNHEAPSAKGNRPDWQQGYGYQFWQSRHGYRGDGANGQYCIVLPEKDVVIAITAETRDMQAEINVVWDKLLPAFEKSRLPENADEASKLKTLIDGLEAKAPPPAPQKK
jgi:CubicO group peptidase (beta-lactamase class C family)